MKYTSEYVYNIFRPGIFYCPAPIIYFRITTFFALLQAE